MAKRSNQDIERHYFAMFCSDYQLPDGTIVYGDKPDVILNGEKKIGIEITNFFIEDGALPESEQIQRNAREAVVSNAQKLYLGDGGKRIVLSFSFDKASPIKNQGKLVKRLVEIAKKIDGQETGEVNRNLFKDIPEVSFIYLNSKEYEDPKWQVIPCYTGQIMSMEKLRAIVSNKEAQSKFYRPCDAYWLIVVVNIMDRAQDQEIRIDGVEKIESTVFERVIVYKTHFGHVFEAK